MRLYLCPTRRRPTQRSRVDRAAATRATTTTLTRPSGSTCLRRGSSGGCRASRRPAYKEFPRWRPRPREESNVAPFLTHLRLDFCDGGVSLFKKHAAITLPVVASNDCVNFRGPKNAQKCRTRRNRRRCPFPKISPTLRFDRQMQPLQAGGH